jgi:pimeloyl-ACP methyl ester carboxylesterase
MDMRARIETAVGGAQYALYTRSVTRLLGFDDGAVDVDGVRVPFLARGWGVPLLMVHGFGGDKESWLLLAAAMRRNRCIVIPDLPGFGAAGAIDPERASAQAQARVLGSLLDHLGYARAHVVGSSMGGGIAIRFAVDAPARVSSMTLIGSVGPVVKKSEVGLAIDRGENPLVVNDVDDLDRLMRLVTERRPPVTKSMRRFIAADKVARRDAQMALFRGWNQPRDGEGLAHIALGDVRTPALVIHGVKDRVIDKSTGEALAQQLPDARLELLEGVGHAPQLEAPRKVGRLIEGFVDALENGRRQGRS